MSYCKSEGKDKIIFVTEEDHNTPSNVDIDLSEEEDKGGLLLPNGDINWNCPCLGGMAVGPCGVEFREGFTCFHTSKEDPQGSDCVEKFREMTECMSHYPGVYPDVKESKDDESKIIDTSTSDNNSVSNNSNSQEIVQPS